ncbi:MAG: hypothetical protein ACR2Q4_17120 [Geminicoccaceae bacterium]
MSHLIFIRSWIAISIVGLVLVAILNIAVDPYGIFGTPRIEGFNAIKPSIGTKVRTAKVHQVLKIRPKAVIIGNSRPEMGLDPEHPCWPETSRPVYNVAIPGLSVYGQIRYGQHAIASGETDLVLIGLDFIDFLVPPELDRDPRQWPVSSEEPMPLRTDANGEPRPAFVWDRLKDQLGATMSLDALTDTGVTLVLQRPGAATTRTPLGFNPGHLIFAPIIRHEGARVLFAQKNESLARRLSTKSWSLNHHQTDWSTQFEALSRLMDQGQDAGIRIIPFINPLHADFLVLIDKAGLWPLMDAWKRRVVTMAAEHGSGPLWDFIDFAGYATESVDDLAAKGEGLRWFWEPSHYRRSLGDRLLSAMLADSCPKGTIEPPLGTALKPTSIEAHLARLRSERDRFIAANRSRVDMLTALIDAVRPADRLSSARH